MAKAIKKSKSTAPATPPAANGGELLDLDQAIEHLKTTRPTFYRMLRAGKLKGMKVGRQWRFYKKDIEGYLKGDEPRVEASVDMSPFLEQLTKFEAKQGGKIEKVEGTNVAAALNRLLLLAFALRASDIHLTPVWKTGSESPVAIISIRLDGVLHTVAEIEVRQLKPLIERIKMMSNMDLHEKWLPQNNRIELRAGGKPFDLRITNLVTCYGDSMTIRILPQDSMNISLERMGFPNQVRQRIETFLARPSGLLIVTGPAGSGKTTVLYGCLSHIAGPQRKTLSLETPVEVSLPWVTQVAVMPERGLTYPMALRAALRSDPDTIMISELRDTETVELAFEAALTGHLVLTTMHTDEASSALRRLLDIGCSPVVASDATRLIVGTRLVRRLCKECSTETQPPEHVLAQAEQVARLGGLAWEALPHDFRAAKGCVKCAQTGFKGRIQISEALEITPQMSAALRRGASADELRALAIGQGMTTFAADGVRRAAEGLTTLDEVLRHALTGTGH